MAELPIITGVICTHNREHFLERAILSLCEQTLERSKYEILVVDNGSTDGTKAICEKFADLSNFRYEYEPVLGLSSARNNGWRNARGKYVGYLDDDAVESRTWFEKALWSFENIRPVPEWVGGPIDLEWEEAAPEWINEELRVTLGWVYWGNRPKFLNGPGERLGGGNSFYLKTVLEEMEGFDTRLGRKKNLLLSGEETQFQHRLKAMGGKLFYHPGVSIFHYVARERIQPVFFYKRYYWGGITDYIMTRSLKDIAFEHIGQEPVKDSKVSRLLDNIWNATGMFSAEGKKIQSRIYLSYVFGWLTAIIKYGWRKSELG